MSDDVNADVVEDVVDDVDLDTDANNEDVNADVDNTSKGKSKSKVNLDDLDDDVKSVIKELRAEAAKKRVAAKEAEKAKRQAETATSVANAEQAKTEQLLDALRAANILPPKDAHEDLAETTKKLSQVQKERRDAKVELAVYRTANNLGADAEAILDSRTFMSSIDDLDHSSATFNRDVKDAIEDLVENSTKFRLVPKEIEKAEETKTEKKVAGRSGGAGNGGAGAPAEGQLSEAQVATLNKPTGDDKQDAKNARALEKAWRNGQLKSLGYPDAKKK